MKELTLRKIAEACHGTVAPEAETVTVTGVQSDSRRVRPGDLFVAIKGEKADGHDFVAMAASLGAKAALVARPVEAPIPTIHHAAIIRADPARPDIAIITNIGTMHIEHLGSREGILQAKLEIFRGVPKNGVGVFNGDEPLLWNVRANGGHKKYYFGIENHSCDVLATDIQELEDGMRFVVSGFGHRFELFVPVLGRHTVYNALAAVTAALLLKIPPETIQAQISGFQNTGMRQKIYERDGFTIIEDCYNAGPESTEAALDILAGFRARAKGRCIAVLGDMLELGNRSAAEHYRIGRIAAAKVDMLYTYGTNSERMVSGAITGGMKQKFVEHFDTHEDLAHMLKMRARPGDVILFKGSRGMRMEKALSLFLKEEKS